MSGPANLLRLLNEFVLLLLGALLILIAVAGHIGLPSRPAALTVLGVFFVYWGLRAWIRPEPNEVRLQTTLRAASLAIVGLLIIGIPILPLRRTELLIGLAGGVLVVRGLLAAFLSLRRS
jgi:hypothetical protein